jgi:sugar lactone lactonase YvrE
VYIAEGLHDVVQVFDARGRLLLVFGQSGAGPGEFALPSGMHIDASNRLYVADTLNGRIQVFQYVTHADAQ